MDIYHVLNRGVDKRKIVDDDSDRLRFVHSLFVFNDKNIVNENHRRKGIKLSSGDRDILVHIHAWCLMNNHYHLLLSPVDDDLVNLSLFMKKLNMGYTKYYNERHKRSGYLWQGKYKKILVENDAHFLYLPYYIHLNPLDYKMKEWRSGGLLHTEIALQTLKDYRWSSYLDYNQTSNFNSLLTKDFLTQILGNNHDQNNQIQKIITDPTLAVRSLNLEN